MMSTQEKNVEERIKGLQDKLIDLQEKKKKDSQYPTEVYTRIVGYYRSVANWNKGKREEYGLRKTFVPTAGQLQALDNRHREENQKMRVVKNPGVKYLFFWNNHCPQCPSLKALLPELTLEGNQLDTDSDEGAKMALQWEVYSTPTLIILDSEEQEVDRIFTSSAFKEFLG